MARYVAVVQIECDGEGKPLTQNSKALLRYGIIDRRRKYKTFFSGRNHKVCVDRAAELNKTGPSDIEEPADGSETVEE